MTVAWWLWALAGIGVFAVGSALVTLFSALGRRPGQLHATASPRVASHDFLAALAGSVNGAVKQGGTATLLRNGVEFIPALLADMAAAERTIDFMVYIWEAGEMGDRFASALASRAADGVQVRVLLDGLGAFRIPDDHVALMKEAGVHVARFRPLRFGLLTRFHKRNHRRAIIMDGRIGYTGGAAVGDKWLGDAEGPDHWRDDLVRVTGRMAGDVQSAFAELWASCCGELLIGPEFFPSFDDAIPENAPRYVALISSPSYEEHPVRLFFNLSILSARDRLWITTPYFVPDRGTCDSIMDRARAGVDVRLLLPNEYTDARPIRWAAHSHYQELLDAGVRIWEYQPTMLHSKALVADSVWSIVGSANLDIRSKELNEENLFGILDPGFAQQLEASFERDLAASREITSEGWRRRGRTVKILEAMARIFSEQY